MCVEVGVEVGVEVCVEVGGRNPTAASTLVRTSQVRWGGGDLVFHHVCE
jgi:hypothetical protein